ncbi:hypothetical protein ACFW04_006111 [Cataglyphis niger]
MVQDMYDPEYFFKQYEVKNTKTGESDIRCGMYTDAARCLSHEEISFDSNKNEYSERQTYIVMSIPGLNKWAKEQNKCTETNIQKFNSMTCNENMNKRNLDDTDLEEMDCSEPVTKKEKILPDNNDVNKSNSSKDQNLLSEEHILNFPIPMDEGKTCIVKIYDGTILKLNQVIDIIGFISLDPMLNINNCSEDEMNEAEVYTHNPPVSLVPRLHAIKLIELTKSEIVNAPEIVSKAQLIRGDLHIILSQLLFGDHLAADYLICHLLSTIYTRRDYFCLGAFPLNITNFPASRLKTFPKEFYNFLTLLVKKSHFLEVTLENLNELALIPKKDYECNRLTSGILQLSNNTHLVLDETGLTTGELSVTGKKNYKTLSDLLMFQKLTYDFKYYTMEYETDIPILIFSDVKSFVPIIQDDFVEMRSVNKNISADNLHSLMVFARWMSLSYGQTALDIECWKRTVQLEMERMSRLPQCRR